MFSPELLQVVGSAVGAVLVALFTYIAHRVRKMGKQSEAVRVTVEEVARSVNGVEPGETKLIDKVRGLVEDVTEIKQRDKAQHLAIVSVDTTMHAFSERLAEVGRKADVASKLARESHQSTQRFIEEQNAIATIAASQRRAVEASKANKAKKKKRKKK